MTVSPLSHLKIYLKETVEIKLKSGELLEGILESFDEHNNLMISPNNDRNLLFVRGENIIYISQWVSFRL